MSRTSTIVGLAALLLIAVALPGCPTQDLNPGWGWKAERPATPLKTFSHTVHRDVFAREGFECYACHTMAARIDDEQEAAEAIRASQETFAPGKETCHFCHYNPQTGNTAPDRCGLCHLDLRSIQPANHNFDWINRHAVYAKADAGSCETCHRPSTCQDCHLRRDQSVRTFHDRNIRFTHGIEARANPMRCGECHAPRFFCQKCHVEGGYER